MYHRWAALTLVLALWCLTPKSAAGQSALSLSSSSPEGVSQGASDRTFRIPSIRKPASPSASSARDGRGGSTSYPSASTTSWRSSSPSPCSRGRARPPRICELPCGNFVAFWDGKVQSTGREAASGVYIYELVVDGERTAKKMFVAK